jgi:hypothetical protein
MLGEKMETTKRTLALFIQSLPNNCMFDIISFGDRFDHMYNASEFGETENCAIRYTDDNIQKALQKTKEMDANMGGTEIY